MPSMCKPSCRKIMLCNIHAAPANARGLIGCLLYTGHPIQSQGDQDQPLSLLAQLFYYADMQWNLLMKTLENISSHFFLLILFSLCTPCMAYDFMV